VTGMDAVAIARARFLDEHNQFGCAETTYIVLKGAFGLDDPMDSSAAMALNGGVAYSGGTCGAISGAALAVGMIAERRIADHREAKRVARELIARLMDEFAAEQGSVDCRELIGIDLRAPGGHERFIASGAWRGGCVRRVESAVRRLAPLAGRDAWEQAVRDVDAPRA
jgi:C_GCAxxG_C_C family probable redox protein